MGLTRIDIVEYEVFTETNNPNPMPGTASQIEEKCRTYAQNNGLFWVYGSLQYLY